jgi:hypothetical protein
VCKCKLEEWVIIKETKHTYLLGCSNREKRMYKKAWRLFAHKTKNMAMRNYIARKNKQLEIYNNKVQHIESLIRYASTLYVDKEEK